MNPPSSAPISSIPSNALPPSSPDVRQAQGLQPPPPKKDEQEASPAQNQPDSTVVKISAEGQQLSHAVAQNQNSENNQAPENNNAPPPPKKQAEPPGIQFLQSESKGGHVKTYA